MLTMIMIIKKVPLTPESLHYVTYYRALITKWGRLMEFHLPNQEIDGKYKRPLQERLFEEGRRSRTYQCLRHKSFVLGLRIIERA